MQHLVCAIFIFQTRSSTKAKTIEPREIFMTLPSKAPGYGYPRDVQSEVWKKWFDIRNEKNVILKIVIQLNKFYCF